ncbi:hypothetical protein M8C21_011934, partial [Ambrosia artemisiifolia]
KKKKKRTAFFIGLPICLHDLFLGITSSSIKEHPSSSTIANINFTPYHPKSSSTTKRPNPSPPNKTTTVADPSQLLSDPPRHYHCNCSKSLPPAARRLPQSSLLSYAAIAAHRYMYEISAVNQEKLL